MENMNIIENMLISQSEILATSRTTQTIISDTAAILIDKDDLFNIPPKHGGSVKGRSANLPRDFEAGYQRLFKDYFAESPVYTDYLFRRRFRMHRDLFLRIVDDVTAHDRYFVQKKNALGQPGLRPIQKICSAIRMLAYGGAADANDEYLRLSESTSLESLSKFCTAIIEIYGEGYLRSPTTEDVKRILSINEKRGFPGMLGSLDCMHWGWKNCPAAWKGQYQGKEKKATIILEAVVSQDLWFWHSFFGIPGSHNDINVLDMSPLFTNILNGVAPKCTFLINGNEYSQAYFLADGIYPDYATIVKTISQPQGLERQHFAKMQEALRKDVERAFGVLQARFAIVAQPARGWSQKKLYEIMKTCIILHNMIVENERGSPHEHIYDGVSALVEPARMESADFLEFVRNYQSIRDEAAHHQLKNDLIKHLWAVKGRSLE
ncbi:hypothetical protein Pst134EA_033057 [Puccinia striiformis f. sp. tritici]|uniref:hypothetical protein n=1 Tax=Puccinia striiformis f. sp. tritici TaxID=168172 RepID=UPI0020084FD4|nr:hypothetical protein Pst134EA_033057 [Puccinia striiformis f. sp. tritici]KAH9457201.1 hypothetical protein Pst134EA_033057 [Puccinia striiformis f. sp. tritici]